MSHSARLPRRENIPLNRPCTCRRCTRQSSSPSSLPSAHPNSHRHTRANIRYEQICRSVPHIMSNIFIRNIYRAKRSRQNSSMGLLLSGRLSNITKCHTILNERQFILQTERKKICLSSRSGSIRFSSVRKTTPELSHWQSCIVLIFAVWIECLASGRAFASVPCDAYKFIY